jgi:hypothetical protein
MKRPPSWTATRCSAAVTGNIVFPGFTAPKLVGPRHEPQVWDRVAKVLLPKDYLRLWLTGEHVARCRMPPGPAGWIPGARLVGRSAGRATGLTRDQMPRLVEGSEVSGTLRAALAKRWGLPRAWSWRAAAATTRPRASAWAWCARARPLSRLAPRACCLPRMTAISPTRPPPCTPSAMRCRTHLAPDGRDPGRDRCAELVCAGWSAPMRPR